MITVVLVIAIIAVCAVGTTAWADGVVKSMAPPLVQMMEPTTQRTYNEHSKGPSGPVH